MNATLVDKIRNRNKMANAHLKSVVAEKKKLLPKLEDELNELEAMVDLFLDDEAQLEVLGQQIDHLSDEIGMVKQLIEFSEKKPKKLPLPEKVA
jgi:predicted RNase H-like nuclease (RuvC/YqgF family)